MPDISTSWSEKDGGTRLIEITAKKDLKLPLRILMKAVSPGAAELRAQFTFVYCREDNTGTCRIKTLIWRVPLEVVADPAASAEIKLTSRVKAE